MFIGCCMSAQMRNAGMCVCVCVRVCLLQFFFFPKCCHILLHQIRVFGKLLQVTRHGANENFQPNAAKGLMHGPCEGLTQPHPCRKNSTPTEKKAKVTGRSACMPPAMSMRHAWGLARHIYGDTCQPHENQKLWGRT